MPDINRDLLVAITDGMGATAGKAVRGSFHRIAERLIENRTFGEWSESKQQFALDVLVLAVVYQQVIFPLSGSNRLIRRLKTHGVSAIKLPRYSLGSEHTFTAKQCVESFWRIVEKFKITPDLIFFTTTKDFTAHLDEYFRSETR